MPAVIRLGTVGSTNDEALTRARAGTLPDGWVVAGEQTGGRGRHGRRWSSPTGGLYATRLITTDLPLAELVSLTLVAGVAVHDTAAALLPGDAAAALQLKWPNDLLAGSAKLAGILVETDRIGAATDRIGADTNRIGAATTAVAIGIGLNVAMYVAGHVAGREGPGSEIAAIEGLGGGVDTEAAFRILADRFETRYADWAAGKGLAAIRAAWEDRALGIGTAMRVRLPGGTISGAYAGLDADGGLLIRRESGDVQVVRAGEVFLGKSARNGAEKENV